MKNRGKCLQDMSFLGLEHKNRKENSMGKLECLAFVNLLEVPVLIF